MTFVGGPLDSEVGSATAVTLVLLHCEGDHAVFGKGVGLETEPVIIATHHNGLS